MIKEQILNDLKRVLERLNLPQIEPALEHPSQESHGDYATNVALVLWRQQRANDWGKRNLETPLDLAKEIVECYKKEGKPYLAKIEVAPPGFINLWLSKGYLLSELQNVLNEKDKFGSDAVFTKKKVMIEFTDPNPFKEFHIGHLYSNTVGESLSRLFESQRAEVKRVCYQGDVGLHVAKAIWGMQKLMKEDGEDLQSYENKPLKTRMFFLGRAYTYGAKEYEENETAKKEIEALNIKIYQKDSTILELWRKGRDWSLDHFETIYQRLGTKFSKLYFESEAGRVGAEYVRANVGKVFEESQGAVVFRGEKYGLHTRVFINSQGLPTYEAKELGLAPTKHKDFHYDLSLIVTGNEITEYFRVLIKVLSLINAELAARTKHVAHGMVRLAGGKISSRLGTLLTGEWLLDEAKRRILKAFPDMDKSIPEIVAVGAVKYALLKNGIGKDIIFDFDRSISLEGNSGPYLQYTFARAQSVLKKASGKVRMPCLPSSLNPEEVSILRNLYKLPELVEEASRSYSPNLICSYLFELAQEFNLFYQKHPILKAENSLREFRLGLTQAVGQVIKNGLFLLGISAPKSM